MDVKLGGTGVTPDPPFSLDRTREYFRQLCLGLEYLHFNGVIHRDVSRLHAKVLTPDQTRQYPSLGRPRNRQAV